MGRYMADHDLTPDLVVCSTARRARQTCELALAAFDGEIDVRYDEDLYHAAAGELLEAIRHVADDVGRVMIVGHNPGMHALALGLTDQYPGTEAALRIGKYPTAALAVIGFDLDRWRDIEPGSGQLETFIRPKDLDS